MIRNCSGAESRWSSVPTTPSSSKRSTTATGPSSSCVRTPSTSCSSTSACPVAAASGYLLKDGSTYEQVAEAVRLVASGQSLISPSMATKLLDEFVQMSKSPAPTSNLTPRELGVLRHVARGLSNREIAEELFISENTVKNHIRNMLEKLQMKSRMEAAMYAVRSNLLDDMP